MSATALDPRAFQKLIAGKTIVLTEHAQDQLLFRQMSETALKADLKEVPAAICEQMCETGNERKFEVYYPQRGDHYHTYIVVSNGQVRIVSVWRSNRIRQEDISRGKRILKR